MFNLNPAFSIQIKINSIPIDYSRLREGRLFTKFPKGQNSDDNNDIDIWIKLNSEYCQTLLDPNVTLPTEMILSSNAEKVYQVILVCSASEH